MRSDPPASYTYLDRVFANEMNHLIQLTDRSYEATMYREALKTGFYDMQVLRAAIYVQCFPMWYSSMPENHSRSPLSSPPAHFPFPRPTSRCLSPLPDPLANFPIPVSQPTSRSLGPLPIPWPTSRCLGPLSDASAHFPIPDPLAHFLIPQPTSHCANTYMYDCVYTCT